MLLYALASGSVNCIGKRTDVQLSILKIIPGFFQLHRQDDGDMFNVNGRKTTFNSVVVFFPLHWQKDGYSTLKSRKTI